MRLFLLPLLALGLAACQTETDTTASNETAPVETDTTMGMATSDMAVATLTPLDSSGVSGTVEFRRIGDATEIRYTLAGLPAGEHGFHLHENPACGPDSTGAAGGAAGGHFNPASSPHGAPTASMTGRHAGDFGNVTADAQGNATGIVIDSVLTFEGPTSLVQHAVIVHEKRDDLQTQPTGDAGGRLACGIAELSPAR